jgi:hypothetical protein
VPACAATSQLHGDIVPGLADFFDLLRKRQCQLALESVQMKRPLTGAMSRATIMAMTRSRQRLRGGPSMRSRCHRKASAK